MRGNRYIPTGALRKEHAELLKVGIARLPGDFVGELCWACKGLGERPQTFTHGCGGGYYKSTWECDICYGEGLLVGGKPAPVSVTEQVLTVAKRELV